MEKLNYSITINAPKSRVWEVLWNDESYRAWTKAFSEGSHAISDWKEGSKVLFLDGNGQGMVSVVDKVIPNEFMSFKHLGCVMNGVEDMESEEVKKWAGAFENYTLRDVNGNTELIVEIDINEEHKKYFGPSWPKAMQDIKDLSEAIAVA